MLTALDRLGEGRTLVVGDRLDADIAAAAKAGLDAALVLTGTDPPTEAELGELGGQDGARPVAVAPNLGTLVLGEENGAGS